MSTVFVGFCHGCGAPIRSDAETEDKQYVCWACDTAQREEHMLTIEEVLRMEG